MKKIKLFLLISFALVQQNCEKEIVGYGKATSHVCGCHFKTILKIQNNSSVESDTLTPSDTVLMYLTRSNTPIHTEKPINSLKLYYPYLKDIWIFLATGTPPFVTVMELIPFEHIYFMRPFDDSNYNQTYKYTRDEFVSKASSDNKFSEYFYMGIKQDFLQTIPRPATYRLLITAKDSFEDQKIITASCLSPSFYITP